MARTPRCEKCGFYGHESDDCPTIETRVYNAERSGYDTVGPCWFCHGPTRYFVDEDGTPRDIEPFVSEARIHALFVDIYGQCLHARGYRECDDPERAIPIRYLPRLLSSGHGTR